MEKRRQLDLKTMKGIKQITSWRENLKGQLEDMGVRDSYTGEERRVDLYPIGEPRVVVGIDWLSRNSEGVHCGDEAIKENHRTIKAIAPKNANAYFEGGYERIRKLPGAVLIAVQFYHITKLHKPER